MGPSDRLSAIKCVLEKDSKTCLTASITRGAAGPCQSFRDGTAFIHAISFIGSPTPSRSEPDR